MSLDVARANIDRYGQFPVAGTFATNDSVIDRPEASEPAYSAAFDPDGGIRRHAACDECRMLPQRCLSRYRSDHLQESAS